MPRRLGELLIARGLLTQEQLDEALQTQLISGGHLGTSLLDLGFINERDLGESLAEIKRVNLATQETLSEIPQSVINLLPAMLAEKHLAVPLKVEDDTLHVAVVSPQKLSALSSRTGYRIVAWIAPEVRIYEALETYYGIARRPRYARLCKEIDDESFRKDRALTAARLRQAPAAEAVAESTIGSDAQIDIPEADFGYGTDWRTIADEFCNEDDEAQPEKSEKKKLRTTRQPPRIEIDDVLDRICAADYKEEVSEALLDYASQRLKTCMLLSVRSQLARIWDCRGLKLGTETIRSLRWPVIGGSIFALLLGRSHYRGPVPDDAACRHFYGTLRMKAPAEVLLCPIYVNDRLVAIFYGDGGADGLEGDTEPFLLLGDKLSLAIHLLILKMKIRSI